MTTLPDDFIVTIGDIRKAGHCVAGARAWFAAHDLDFRDFLSNGISAATLLATEDGLAEQVVSRTAERRNG